jgi:hypothetical protein
MFRTTGFALAALAAVAAWSATAPATAQERGGLHRRGPTATLDQIEANRGCPLSNTSVTFGVNRAFGNGSAAQQQLGTLNAPGNAPGSSSGCRPLVTTQVAGGVNLALGRGSSAGQTIEAQGQRGALATTTFTRGFNAAVGARSSASQRILNQVGR